MTERDRDRERLFLRAAAPLTRTWRDQVAERLDAAQEDYGDSWAGRSLDELFKEIVDEAIDIGAWSALAEQLLERRTGLTPDQRDELRSRLVSAAKCGTLGWVHIAQARDRLRELEAGGSR